MKTNHTPGEWRVTHDSWHPLNKRITSSAKTHIAKVYACSASDDGGAAANAALIAAAPELLQALKAICEHANEAWAALDHDYHEVLAGNLGDAVDQARAVIAKAKGESE